VPKIINLKTSGRKSLRHKIPENGSEQFRFNSFFAGIGGFDLGFERMGISPAFHCEINDFCNSVLRRHWPNLPHSNNINKVDIDQLPDAEIWCGGFPCQDVSVARGWIGRDGLNGKNSGLFYPFLELIKKKLPRVVVLENVTGLLSSHRGRDFKTIITSFTELGYGVAWRVMNARYFGAPQSRPRVFVCAWKGRVDLALHALYEEESSPAVKNVRKGFITPTVCQYTGAAVPLVGYCLAATSGRHTGTDWSRTYVAYYDKVRRLTPNECEGLQGFPTGWSLPEKDYPLCDDEIDTLRYHAIGNAVCVPVIEWIANRIVLGISGKFNDITVSKSLSTQSQNKINSTFSDFRNSSAKKLYELLCDGNEKISTIRWTNGGSAYGEWYIADNVSPAPNNIKEKKLLDIIEKRDLEEKYFLSPNAAEGILRRVNKQGRTLFEPLHEALKRLALKRYGQDVCVSQLSQKSSK